MGREESAVEVGVFGSLRKAMEANGRPYRFEYRIAPTGCTASQLASAIGLPLAQVEVVFRNGRVINIHDPINPGDRVSFFPYGTPGPYRIFLGILRETRKRERIESGDDRKTR